MHTLIAANWKMYKTRAEAHSTAQALAQSLKPWPSGRKVVVFAPFTALTSTAEGAAGSPIEVGAEDVYPAVEGAFTGEISPAMLRDAGATWVLTGHSERRHVLGESDAFVGQKTAFALANGLAVTLCVGEKLEERTAGELEAVLHRQLKAGLANVPADLDVDRLSVAYEPVWAIGTGKVASPADIIEAHALTRKLLLSLLGDKANKIAILYGGSVKADNASAILALDNVNGLLVGGASLQAESFARIVCA